MMRPRFFPAARRVLLFASCFALLATLCFFVPSSAQEKPPHNQERAPGPALSPEEAIKKMTVPEGFSVELVAARARHRQPGRDDLRRTRPDLDHREPGISAA